MLTNTMVLAGTGAGVKVLRNRRREVLPGSPTLLFGVMAAIHSHTIQMQLFSLILNSEQVSLSPSRAAPPLRVALVAARTLPHVRCRTAVNISSLYYAPRPRRLWRRTKPDLSQRQWRPTLSRFASPTSAFHTVFEDSGVHTLAYCPIPMRRFGSSPHHCAPAHISASPPPWPALALILHRESRGHA